MMCVFWLFHQLASPPSLSFSSGLPLPQDTTIDIRPINNPTKVPGFKWKEELHIPHFKSKSRNLNEEGMSKATEKG